jgi:proteasome accessory factor B
MSGAQGPAAYQAKLKRLLDLVVLLLDARRPLGFEEIRDQFPEYRTAKAFAGKRTFERDKADLLELGVPIEWVPPEGEGGDGDEDGGGEGGYVLRRRALQLPPIQLSSEEAALIYLAASAARSGAAVPYLDAASLALRKIAFDLPPGPGGGAPPPILVNLAAEGADDPAFARHLEALHEAVRLRKRVHVVYRAAPPLPLPTEAPGAHSADTTERDFDPYGLLYREGAWVAVGYCHLRKEVRTFRVDRIVSLVRSGKPKTPDFEVPSTIDLNAYGSRSPWRFEAGPSARVTLLIAPSVRFVAEEDFGDNAERAAAADGSVEVTFTCANLGFLRERVLAARGALRIAGPASLRRELLVEVRAARARHLEAGA